MNHKSWVAGWAVVVMAGMLWLDFAQISLAQDRERELMASIKWDRGPCVGHLGSVAEIDVPEGFSFADARNASIWAELTQNVPNSAQLGVIVPNDLGWFMTFTYDESGYVRDDEKDSLDADGLLTTLRQNTEIGNAYRRDRGWDALTIQGWQQPPAYDEMTNRLTWAILGTTGADGDVVNYNARLLGRQGVMSANLVAGPRQFGAALPTAKGLLTGFRFKQGMRYAEWRAGDRVAEYGLAALLAGGAAGGAAKMGLFSKLTAMLAKSWKVLAALGVAALAGLAKLFKGAAPSEAAKPEE
jgi:uncharacterized membrane-anchored protein